MQTSLAYQGPLAGVRVLDLSSVIFGPMSSQVLADYGAEVIKIENPDGGDDTRAYEHAEIGGESAAFLSLNRNKRGIVLNLKSQAGKEVFRKLVAQSDVVLENYRPGVMDRLGLGYEELRKINRIIEKEYPDAKVVKLEQNYRSTVRILKAANAVISHNEKLFDKKLWSDLGHGDPVTVTVCHWRSPIHSGVSVGVCPLFPGGPSTIR